jgi:hypothetical protein
VVSPSRAIEGFLNKRILDGERAEMKPGDQAGCLGFGKKATQVCHAGTRGASKGTEFGEELPARVESESLTTGLSNRFRCGCRRRISSAADRASAKSLSVAVNRPKPVIILMWAPSADLS